MMVMVPGEGFGEAPERLRGKRVLVWSCSTCARMCGVGGKDAEERARAVLEDGGAEVVGSTTVSAACLMPKARGFFDGAPEADEVLALCCGLGAGCARRASGLPVWNPVATLGPGYLDDGGVPRLEDARRTYHICSSRFAADNHDNARAF